MKPNKIDFHLGDIPNEWFHNNAASRTSVSDLKNHTVEVFNRAAARKLRAEQRLRTGAQRPGESFTSFIEDVVNLCDRVDSAMAKAEQNKT